MEDVPEPPPRRHESARGCVESLLMELCVYYATTVVVLLGVLFGLTQATFCTVHPKAARDGFWGAFFSWDGRWYRQITLDGYSYRSDRESNVAFFPGYPLAAASVSRLTGLDPRAALLLVSNLSFVAALSLLAYYVKARFPQESSRLRDSVLIAIGIFPTTFYFRMAYSESLLLLLCLLTLVGMERRWGPVWLAFIIGMATATRPVGIALLPPFIIYLRCMCSPRMGMQDGTSAATGWRNTVLGLARLSALGAILLPVACWGILAYVAYQYWTFDEPLAFVKTQAHWGRAAANVHVWRQAWRLLTLGPIRAPFDPASPCYWGLYSPHGNPLFNLMFANPIYFLFAVGCVAFGAWKRWLNAKEVALSAGLLLIPYVTQADRMCMASQARFASVVFPMYIVLGHILARLPGPVAALLAALSAVMLALYSALFVNWYWFY